MIILILILGLFLRLINLNQSLWLDETVQAITSKGSFLGIFTELRGDFHPPLYHLLMWGWAHLFGNGEIVMRLPSVIFGVATIWVVYKIVRSWELGVRSKETGVRRREIGVRREEIGVRREEKETQNSELRTLPLIAALFLATAPFHIYYSQEARTYAMTTFFTALSMYYFIRLVRSQELGVRNGESGDRSQETGVRSEESGDGSQERGEKDLAFRTPVSELNTQNLKYILFTTLMLYSDYYGIFVFLAQIIAAAIIFRKKFLSKYLSKYLYIYISIFLLFLPCLPLLWLQLKTGSQATTFLPEWGRLVNLSFLKALPLTFIKFSIGRITIFNKTLYAIVVGILFVIYGGMILIGFRGQGLATSRKKNYLLDPSRQSLITILFWFLVPILLAWGISFFVPNYQPFRLLLALPAFYLLLAFGISKFSTPMIRIIGIIFILLVNLISLGVYYQNPYFHREDWRGAVGYIESQDGKSSLALIPSETSHWPYDYYSQGKVPLWGVAKGFNKVGSQELGDRSQNSVLRTQYSHIYYIYYLADLFDPQNLIPNWLEKQNFVKIREVSFNQIRIQEWERNE